MSDKISNIRLRVSLKDKSTIAENAKSTGLSTSEFLRRVGKGEIVKPKIDEELILELIKINSDLGRLGRLLKLALDREIIWKKAGFETITELLEAIQSTKDELKEKILLL